MDPMRLDAEYIIESSLKAVMPDEAVRRALEGRLFKGKFVLLAIGKAAWQMAAAASACLGGMISEGLVITKYGHSRGEIPGCRILEAGHPVPDENSFDGAEAALEMVAGLEPDDTVIFLISGGGSALFELPLVPADELQDITRQLLASGAGITEINTIRKRLSGVKGGRFACKCPAHIYQIVLSDILGDPLDMIASGPASPDPSTCEEALEIAERYGLRLSDQAMELLHKETPKSLDNVESSIVGSVSELCRAAAEACRDRGYEPVILTDMMDCEAREAGAYMGALARMHAEKGPIALIAGGETVVKLTGSGKGGRNQELALAAAEVIAGLDNVLIFSLGSDGTDGPTDAAGGIVDGSTKGRLEAQGNSIQDVLADNDAYNALKAVDSLIMTGPTGTNVNDIAVALITN